MGMSVALRAVGPIPLDIALQVNPGEVLALVGPSGAGKSPVLRAIAGLWRPTQARVSVAGQVWADSATGLWLPPHRRRLGFVAQSYALFPHMTALQNVIAALDHLPRADRRAEAQRLLALVNLPDLQDRRPAELSGGQQQRVAVARALARRPLALLLDEPFSAVDRATREKLQTEILALRADLAMPVVLVTHDLNEAQLLADRMVVIAGGQVLGQGTTAEVMADPAALRFMGIREVASLLSARIAAQEADGLTRLDTATGPLFLPAVAGAVGDRLRVRILAHEVILSRARPIGLSAQNILPAVVADIRPGDGPAVLVRLMVGDEPIIARITRRAVQALALEPGDGVHAVLKTMSIARDQVARSPGGD